MAGNVIELTDTTFDETVHSSDVPVLVDFWAPWCGPCKALAPIVDEISKEYDGRLRVVKADVGQTPEAAAKYNVSSIPNIVIIDGGEVKTQLPGLRPKQELIDALQPYLN